MMHVHYSADVRSVVGLGADPEDIEIGCAGTLLELAADLSEVHFVIATADEVRSVEARESANRLLGAHCAVHVATGSFQDGFLPYDAERVKSFMRARVDGLSPDIVFAPSRDDLHQDHRFIGEVALQLFRDHLILEYEVPKYDGDMGRPNFYVPLSEGSLEGKVDHLLSTFASQQGRSWYRSEVFRSLAVLRGVESRALSGFAEAFYARKVVFG